MNSTPRAFITTIAALITTCAGALAATINVPADQPTVQDAINIATPGSEILLADGVHSGVGNRDINFMGKLITVRSASGNPAACVIDCQGLGRGFVFNSAETPASQLRSITVRNGDALGGAFGGGAHCLASSPTIANCRFEQCEADSGGGLSIVSSTALVLDCVIDDCEASVSGAGVYVIGGGPTLDSLTVTNNTITGNNGLGGGMHLQADDSTIDGCVIQGNMIPNLSGGGGGVSCQTSTAFFRDTVIRDNFAFLDGGGLKQNGGSIELLGCDIIDNESNRDTGAMHGNGAIATFTNCRIMNNGDPMFPDDGTEIDLDGNSTVTFVQCLVVSTPALSFNHVEAAAGSSCDFFNCTLDVDFANSGGQNVTVTNTLLTDGSNSTTKVSSIVAFNDFVDAPGGDYTPAPGSSAIDAGDNTLVPVDDYDLDMDSVMLERLPLDLAGNPRFIDDLATPDTGMSDGLNPIVDIGAYEAPSGMPPSCPWDLDGDGNVGSGDLAQLIGSWTQMGVPADFDGGGVGASDLATLIGRWGPCP